ncbi:MAG: AraC family transcriptional regulator ligand-binding domain-containing protein [Janthinobacterium lividum]
METRVLLPNSRTPARAASTRRGVAICRMQLLMSPARAGGYDTDALLRRVGVTPQQLADPLHCVTPLQFAHVVRQLQHAMRDELLGFTTRPVKPGTFRLIVGQMLRCATLGEALRMACSLYHLAIDDFGMRVHFDGDLAVWNIIDHTPPDAHRWLAHTLLLYWGFGLACWMVQRHIPLHDVRMRAVAPLPQCAGAEPLFDTAISYGHGQSRVAFDAQWLQQPLAVDVRGLNAFLLNLPAQPLVSYREDRPLAQQVRRQLRGWDVARLPELSVVAQAMGQPSDGLRRRLREEGESYRAIVDQLRRELALRLLSQPHLSLAEVGERLGFSEPSAFHRACRRWTGRTPVDYRRMLAMPNA